VERKKEGRKAVNFVTEEKEKKKTGPIGGVKTRKELLWKKKKGLPPSRGKEGRREEVKSSFYLKGGRTGKLRFGGKGGGEEKKRRHISFRKKKEKKGPQQI